MKKLKPIEERSWLSAREAANVVGCTVRHIQNLVTEGKLAAPRNEYGHFEIQKCELYRVFPESFAKEQARIEEDRIKNAARTLLENEIEHLKTLMSEKEKLNEFLKHQLDQQSTEKRILLDTLGSNQRLLENHADKLRVKRKMWPFR